MRHCTLGLFGHLVPLIMTSFIQQLVNIQDTPSACASAQLQIMTHQGSEALEEHSLAMCATGRAPSFNG